MSRIVIAPDSFKGSCTAAAAAGAMARGWLAVRPQDEVIVVPMADGGEGTAEAIRDATPGSLEIPCSTTAPDGTSQITSWLLLPDGTAVVELATASGLPLLSALAPLTAQTTGFGEQLAAAARHPAVRRIAATLGGSGSTDGGTGALRALGARFLDADGRDLPDGGAALQQLAAVELDSLTAPPPEGVEALTDVTAPLCGPQGAAHVFGPQKGADPAQVTQLDAALSRLAEVLGGDPWAAGAGAAGGAGYGLATCWGATIRPGAPEVARIVGLPQALDGAHLVITGEGRFDEQSLTGKVVGHVLSVSSCPVALVAGAIRADDLSRFAGIRSLTELAGGADPAMAAPLHWLEAAGSQLAGEHLSG